MVDSEDTFIGFLRYVYGHNSKAGATDSGKKLKHVYGGGIKARDRNLITRKGQACFRIANCDIARSSTSREISEPLINCRRKCRLAIVLIAQLSTLPTGKEEGL